jgi:hypothetical protein
LRQITLEAQISGKPQELIYDMQIPVKIVTQSVFGTIIPPEAKYTDFKDPNGFYVYKINDNMAVRTKITPLLQNSKNETAADPKELAHSTELALGAYLENLRLPESFQVEVIK